MGTESIEAVIKPKIRAYREIVASGTIDHHFGLDNLAVLFVTTNDKRMRNMMKAVESIARNGRSKMFGFLCAGRTSPASRVRRLRTDGCSGSRGVGSATRIGVSARQRNSAPFLRARRNEKF
jgi:hypothetical protein